MMPDGKDIMLDLAPFAGGLLGGGTVVALFRTFTHFYLSNRKQNAEDATSVIGQLAKRVSEMEGREADCLEHRDRIIAENAVIKTELAVTKVELAGLKSTIERLDSVHLVAQIIADDNGLIVDWNPSATFLFQWSRLEAVGQPVTMLIPSRIRGRHDKAFAHAMTREDSALETAGKIMETYALKRDGTEIPVTITLHKWRNAAGHKMFSAEVKKR
jgi:PAS domain S-box-containing protein